MNRADILFQFQSTDASTSLTDGHLVYIAPDNGMSMINQILACPSSGGAANYYRIYHAGPEDTPSVSNMIFYAGTSATAKNATGIILDTKILMNPGDRIYCQLHSGNGVTITAYGLLPGNIGTSQIEETQDVLGHEDVLPGSVVSGNLGGSVMVERLPSGTKGY